MTSNKKKKKIILSVLCVVFSATVIIATAVNEFSGSENAAELAEIQLDGWMVLPAALCFVVMITLEYAKYVLMITKTPQKSAFKPREAWALAFKAVMLGRYYDKITPAAVGGQPAQILTLRKTKKISNGMTTAIPIFSMISGQITFILFAVPCFLFSGMAAQYPVLITTAWIGLLFYAFWPVMVFGTMFFPKPTAKFINFIVKILAKIRLVKNPEEAFKRVENEVADYAKNVKLIFKKPLVSGGVLLMSFFSNILVTFIPYFVLKAFGGDIDFGECFLLSTAVESAVYFAPTPGNSGVAEGTFYVVFSRLSTGYVFWAMMLWRFFSYYIYIIVGPLIYLAQHLKSKQNKGSKQ